MYFTIQYSNPQTSFEIDTENPTEVLNHINSINFARKFELILVKNEDSLNIINDLKEFTINFTKGDSIDFPPLKYSKNKKELVLEIYKEFIKEENSKKTEKWFLDVKNKKKALETKRFNEWKIGFEEKKRKERFDFLKPLFITVLILVFISYFGYLLFTGDYKFIGQETTNLNGIIFQTGDTHLGRGVYVQKIKYRYQFNNENFESSKVLYWNDVERKKGDSIKLKISVPNPERNKILEFY